MSNPNLQANITRRKNTSKVQQLVSRVNELKKMEQEKEAQVYLTSNKHKA